MEPGTWQKLVWLAAAGAAGTLARYGLTNLVQRTIEPVFGGLFGDRFPWGTLAVNAIGCFLFGLVWVLTEHVMASNSQIRLIVLVGFLGAFTTFSTYIFDTGHMLQQSQWLNLSVHVIAQNGIGLAAVMLGAMVGRFV